jgi:hypothetical protein
MIELNQKRTNPLVLYESGYQTDWKQQVKALKEAPKIWNDARAFRGQIDVDTIK